MYIYAHTFKINSMRKTIMDVSTTLSLILERQNLYYARYVDDTF